MTSSDAYTKRLESHYAAALDMDELKSQLVNCCRYKKRFQSEHIFQSGTKWCKRKEQEIENSPHSLFLARNITETLPTRLKIT